VHTSLITSWKEILNIMNPDILLRLGCVFLFLSVLAFNRISFTKFFMYVIVYIVIPFTIWYFVIKGIIALLRIL